MLRIRRWLGASHEVADHALLTLRRTPARALAFGLASFVASVLLTVGLTDAAGRQADVTDTFDSLAAQRVQVTTPVRGTPYRELSPEQVEAIRALPGVSGVAWASRRDVLVSDGTSTPVSTRAWTIDGDLDVLALSVTRGQSETTVNRGVLVGGGSPVAGAGARAFDHVVVAGRRTLVGGVVVKSPAIADLLDAVTVAGSGDPLALAGPGELVVGVRTGWAGVVSPRLASILAPGHESSVLVRYPPEAGNLRDGVLGSVDSLVYVTSGAILALGAGAVMIGTYFRVLAERRLLGLYRAIGASSVFVVSTILLEAALIGTAGSLLGTVSGLGGVAARALLTGAPIIVPWWLIVGGAAASLLTNVVGALLPALRTVRESPLSAIRSR